ncbi:Eco57I restriction-modification methylase domain-containing protein [Halosimplex halophilum]|uniref:Eco57I restriction-modification methylase domain-containing protein n=1 Tax=Halosimplex halophilum TaxID=2559572 RepID=UPI00107F2B09|nr:TaqI-like C-terminal specificity domain-containing protein [Halosimplex halophilum]
MTDATIYRTNRDLFSNHYLNDHLRETEPWNEVPDAEVEAAFEEISDLLDEKRDRVEDYNEAQLERNLIRPIFEILDISFEIEETVMRNARRPDYGFFPGEEAADTAFDRENFYEEAIAVADAKRWGRKLDTRGEEKRDFENPSYQIHRYLQETPAQWAVLTNGEKWRLYYGPTSHRLDSFYEIDLPKLLDIVDENGDLEAFKEFYLFFRQDAFLPDQSGDCFLDDVYDESSVFAEELGEDLQENIYEAIRVLAEGFLDTNEDLDEADLDLIHDSSLIYLYRLIFVLYAESEGRNLLPTDNEIYSASYSLNELKQIVVENRSKTQQEYQSWQTDLWDRLEELFVLIDQGSQGQGIPKQDLYIPAYNGGLFRTDPDEDDSVESQFLSEYEVGDAYIAEVIELLTRHEASEGDGKVFVDYSSLDERNLGSIYEGLLEYKLSVADEPLAIDDGEYVAAGDDDTVTVETGEVYLRTDDGERKATGSYYTPEYVVEYIVDETLGPLVEEIRQDLMSQGADTTHSREGGFAEEFAERIFDLTVLDPAMGSGHFPVNAVDYLAREIIDAQERQDRQALDTEGEDVRSPRTEEGELRDINWARRKVAQRCIYGVDVNPLATELAKVSLWLRTLAAEQPLAFLDHHLKTGNSLVGSDIEDVLSNGDDETTEDGQLTLQESLDHTRKRAMEHVTDRFQDLLDIDNETLEDAKEMEAVYDEVRDDPLYQKLLAMANVHTAGTFGLDIPDDADERMARALHSDAWENIKEQDWFKSAQAMAEEERFFHWELEFPMAFYNQDGERKADAGFDAIIGNPPYVRQEQLSRSKDFLSLSYEGYDSAADLYVYFLEIGHLILRDGGRLGYIVSNKFVHADYGQKIREILSKENRIEKLIDFHSLPVFSSEVSAYPLIMLAEGVTPSESQKIDIAVLEDLDFTTLRSEIKSHSYEIPQSSLDEESWNLQSNEVRKVLLKLEELSRPLVDYLQDPLYRGILTGLNDAFILSKEEKEQVGYEGEHIKPLLRGKDVHRYQISYENRYLIRIPSGWTRKHSGAQNEEEAWKWFKSEFPKLAEHLIQFRDDAQERYDRGDFWWELRPCDYYNVFSEPKIVYPVISKGPNFAYDRDGHYINDKLYAISGENLPLLGILNSDLIHFWIQAELSGLRGGYQEFRATHVEDVPIPYNISGNDELGELVSKATDLREELANLNLDLLDYLGNYCGGPSLPDIGLFQPTGSNILNETIENYEKLQIERARTKRDGQAVTIEATARYKPEDEDEFETDTYGYTETEFYEAFTLTDLADEEATLVEEFVPVAVEEEIGDFHDNATKNISLIDRLKAMTLPDPDDVADDLRRYIETKERADELDEKIERTDQLIDEIVYDLYDLTEEEIEIVEEAVKEE